MRTVVWSAKSKNEADAQFLYLSKYSPQGLLLVRNRLFETVQKLSILPIGKPGRALGVFEKAVRKTSLIIVYELPDEATISILRILHSSQDDAERL